MRLIDFIGEYDKLLNAYDSCEESNESEIEALLNGLADKIEDKLENCAWIYKQLEGEVEILKKEADRLAQKAKYRSNAAENLKGYIAKCLDGKAIKTKTFTFSYRKSESIEIIGDVPEQYQRTKTVVEPDKTLIKADLKAGAEIPGAELVVKQNLQIK